MVLFKRSRIIFATVLMVASVSVACSTKEDTKPDTADTTTAGTEVSTETGTQADTEANTEADTEADSKTITEDEAIELVKKELGDEFSYIPADALEEKDGNQYYVIYVKKLLEEGTYTTLTTYYVKADGSEVFDKYATNFTGDYVHSGTTGDTTFTVSDDMTFKMTTTGDINQVVTGLYKYGITNSPDVIKLILNPQKIVTEENGETTEENVTDRQGVAVIEGDKLTLSMESIDTIFTKK